MNLWLTTACAVKTLLAGPTLGAVSLILLLLNFLRPRGAPAPRIGDWQAGGVGGREALRRPLPPGFSGKVSARRVGREGRKRWNTISPTTHKRKY